MRSYMRSALGLSTCLPRLRSPDAALARPGTRSALGLSTCLPRLRSPDAALARPGTRHDEDGRPPATRGGATGHPSARIREVLVGGHQRGLGSCLDSLGALPPGAGAL